MDVAGVSKATLHVYKSRLCSKLILDVLNTFGRYDNISEVKDINILKKTCRIISSHPTNIKSHYGYSGALKKYISYIEGTDE